MIKKILPYLILCPHSSWFPSLKLNNELNQQTFLLMASSGLDTKLPHNWKEDFGYVEIIQDYEDDQEIEKIVTQYHKSFQFQKIIAPDERDILRASILREKFQFKGQNFASALAFKDKVVMKTLLLEKGVRVPVFHSIKKPQDLADFAKIHGMPLILKPANATGCKGIYKIETEEDLNYSKRLIEHEAPAFYQVEVFIQGTLYHVNGLIQNHHVVCSWPSVYGSPPLNMLEGKYASSYVLAASNPLTRKLNAYAEKVLSHMPTPSDTAFHLEVFLSDDHHEPIICEIASRVGGKGINQSWLSSFHIDLKKSFISFQYERLSSHLIMPPVPSHLTAEVWIPSRAGVVLHIPSQCPFPWVKEWEVTVNPEDSIARADTIEQIFGGASLIEAETEEEIQIRIQLFVQWFNEELVLQE